MTKKCLFVSCRGRRILYIFLQTSFFFLFSLSSFYLFSHISYFLSFIFFSSSSFSHIPKCFFSSLNLIPHFSFVIL